MTKKILITGAGSGLGKGTALGLATSGNYVIAGVEKWQQVTELRKEIEDKKLEEFIEVVKLDITDELEVENILKYDIDILVNNAGIGETGPLAEIPLNLVRKVLEVNVFSTLNLTQKIVKKMVEKKKGKIIFVSSMAGLSTYPFLGPYNMSKHALEAAAQCLRDELKPLGIKVATINPGPYKTGFNDRMYDSLDIWYDENKNFTPSEPIRKIQKEIGTPNSQFDPNEMIEEMVRVIVLDQHKFRTMLPESIEDWCKDYQKSQWELEI